MARGEIGVMSDVATKQRIDGV
ncbi:uncharacterized protein G2W53_023606 [Senna tora]|uniref:Uncharacterized protein n=1 Tax=Senna tora TaxID=362788 RepID=A0A834WG68_9FABA|nr:uncharacterized protein G2W53_023606 [Senna tora]